MATSTCSGSLPAVTGGTLATPLCTLLFWLWFAGIPRLSENYQPLLYSAQGFPVAHLPQLDVLISSFLEVSLCYSDLTEILIKIFKNSYMP